MVPWFGLEMGLGSSCHSGSRLAECNLAANCYSPMPHTSHIFPISDVACGGAHREVIVQRVDITLLGAARQPVTTYAKPSCVFAPVDHVILANMPCACHDTIIAPACRGTRGKVILTIVADMIICCAIVDKVDVIILADVTAGFSPCDGVEFKIATGAMAGLATRDRVEFKIATDAMAGLATRDRVEFKIATDAMAGLATRNRVEFKIATDAMASFATCNRVGFKIATDAMASFATRNRVEFKIAVGVMI